MKASSNRAGQSLKSLCLFSLLGALTFVLKIAMAGLPNIEPVSLMVILLAVCFGWKGLISVYIYIFLEFLVWGLNLWSVSYMYIWLILFIAAWSLRRMNSSLGWAIVSGIFGLLFGALCALVYIPISGCSGALSWWISGIPFDLLHGAGNFIIALLLFKPLKKVLLLCAGRLGISTPEND